MYDLLRPWCPQIILQDLDFNLVVYSPYRPLSMFSKDSHVPNSLTQAAWGMLNDCYCCSDAVLMYPPYLLALACLMLASAAVQHGVGDVAVLMPQMPAPNAQTPSVPSTPGAANSGSCDLTAWFTGLNVNHELVS